MFGFTRARREPPATPDQPTNLHVEQILVANPDLPSIAREAALRGATGRQLQGVSGYVVGHDRGDPSLTFERVVQPVHEPSRGYARIGFKDRMVLQETINEAGTTNAELTAYQQTMFARIAR